MSDPVGMFVRKVGSYFVAAESAECAISHDSVHIAATWAELEEIFKVPSLWAVTMTDMKEQAQIIQCIKVVRSYTSLGLKEAKDIIDAVKCGNPQSVTPTHNNANTLVGNSKDLADCMLADLKSYGCIAKLTAA